MSSATQYDKPVPSTDGMTKEFYSFCRSGELRFQKCSGCGKWRHVPRLMCAQCGSWEWEWARSSGKGKLFTWTVVERPMHPGFVDDIPYAPAMIELEEGVRMISWVIDCPPDQLLRGMPVEVVFQQIDEELTLPKFRRA
ncbi:MAG: Zn-ribbon domain-containing OB-fold protein [Pseudomonadales bacterium]|nr:Zn-ribbon domain-containing OB-fold protein [Pseudomonadales bacterium]